MVAFSIEVVIKEMSVKLLIEQLDGLADEEGYIRFDVRDETRRAVIFVHIDDQSSSAAVTRDAKSSSGSMKHSTQPPAFSFDATYNDSEVILIGMGVRAHLNEKSYAAKGQKLLV